MDISTPGGLQLYADGRGLHVLDSIQQSKAFNDALEAGGAQPRPFFSDRSLATIRPGIGSALAAR